MSTPQDSEIDDRSWWEKLVDERVFLAGVAIETIMWLIGLGWVEMGSVAGILAVLRQVVTPHHTEPGERRRRRRARNRRRRSPVVVHRP